MDAILDHFGIPVENCMAFGDGENDLSMLVHAGIGVAMGTASDAVKAQADYAAPSVDEDGIAHTLSHFGLIP
jgi:hydroxymethylpyrimidine pyrophosphatase-like HAD family hydrolase